jgi:hypothetical protein
MSRTRLDAAAHTPVGCVSGGRPGEGSVRHHVSPEEPLPTRSDTSTPAWDPRPIGADRFRSGSTIPRCDRTCRSARQSASTRPSKSTPFRLISGRPVAPCRRGVPSQGPDAQRVAPSPRSCEARPNEHLAARIARAYRVAAPKAELWPALTLTPRIGRGRKPRPPLWAHPS